MTVFLWRPYYITPELVPPIRLRRITLALVVLALICAMVSLIS